MSDTQNGKLHAACDECRSRKLKCSGEFPQCSRCGREGIRCVYSPQKQMGRPRKRRRDGASPSTESSSIVSTGLPESNLCHDSGHLMTPPDFAIPPECAASQIDPDFEHTWALSDDTGFAMPYSHENGAVVHPSVDSTTDPTLWNVQTVSPPLPTTNSSNSEMANQNSCACLSTMYLSLNELQNMTTFHFPTVIPLLRHGLNTAVSILSCEKCPAQPFSTIQNVMSLGALLTAIGERYFRALEAINAEAKLREQTGEKKAFRVGDPNPELYHMHTGTPDCPMGFTIELEPKEWRKLSKRAIRAEVFGGGSNPNPLCSVLDKMEERQHTWHEQGDPEIKKLFGVHEDAQGNCLVPEGAQCIRMINQVRRMIKNMDWD